MSWAVVRVQAGIDVDPKARDTMKMLRLTRANHCVLVPRTGEVKGMLDVAKDYITWGEIDLETTVELLEKRGKLVGDHPLTEDHLAEATEYGSIGDLAEALAEGDVRLSDLPDVKPVLRLQPPRKGFASTKNPYGEGGALGYRGQDINELLARMV